MEKNLRLILAHRAAEITAGTAKGQPAREAVAELRKLLLQRRRRAGG